MSGRTGNGGSGADAREILIPLAEVELKGLLSVPPGARGLVIFSHGSGSSRFSRRNRQVAERLQRQGFATLLFDLLTEEEDRDHAARFDIALLSRRLSELTQWVQEQEGLAQLPVGYFGASTGAASALIAAAGNSGTVRAVVSRGGRPDLAGEALHRLRTPVLLIVGGNDEAVTDLNRAAYEQMNAVRELVIVPGATHLFEEPGKLEEVAELAAAWFGKYLPG